MRGVIMWAPLLLLFLPWNQLAETGEVAWEQGLRTELAERAYPLIPVQSELRVEIPGGLFLGHTPISKMEAAVWYLAGSLFLLPNPFFEAGLLLQYPLIDGRSFRLEAGAGTAFSIQGTVISIPLVVSFEGRYFGLSWLEIRSNLQALVYAQGIIAEAGLAAYLRPPTSRLFIGFGPGVAASVSWAKRSFGWTYYLWASIGALL